ncbi:unnamed protein product (macronuclear) [Paramecium tetraurelia]|uniref:HTH OST-type domain-containing protein n=1 Tax=Paramecium tetraurelia TaxID=5888 RepID=A0BDT2_PARTE|nr:uncharacterized protein GSPATT00027729001 [Paramecium tetraurelia]CAK56699.1 unnamed protein product [Paramecium tetraurelia]|eukprot:XP_001424097.1 hypothetical protein (macronuclear) [Paramecium tetraurelia strain d4-2]
MSNNSTQEANQRISPSIDHKPYSETTQYITDNVKQKYDEFNKKFQEPQVQEKWGQAKHIMFERTKEFGFLTFDYFIKTFKITKTTVIDLYGVYNK